MTTLLEREGVLAPSAVPPIHTSQGGQLSTAAGKLILVIDDSPTIQKIVELTLHRAGYEVYPFGDGIEVMRWLARPESRIPDLMLVDLGLPKMDGYELIRKCKARARFATTICVILSQRDGVVDKLKGRMVGAQGYITKPFTTQSLLASVHTFLAPSPVAF
jgi:DNA-binding response OmpR family regulator